MAKVDVVVPCYNYGRYLEACVGSVLNQSVSDVRVLVIDDASSDNSALVARKLAAGDSRVEVRVHAKNQGHINTYNEGIEWADSDYFLLLSADDLLLPGAFARAVAVMDKRPDVVLTHGAEIVWYDGSPFPELPSVTNDETWVEQHLIQEMCHRAINFVSTPTAIGRTSVQKTIGGYRTDLPHSGDMEMWLRFAAHGTVVRFAAAQGVYRRHATAMSNAYFATLLRDYQQRKLAFDSFFNAHSDRSAEVRDLQLQADRTLAHQAFQSGIKLIRRGRFGEAVKFIRWSVQLNPQLLYSPPLSQLLKLPGPEGRRWALSVLFNRS